MKILLKPYLHVSLITVVGIIAYSNTFQSPFVFDDFPNIVQNVRIRSMSNIFSLFINIKGPPIAARPLTSVTFAINYFLNGLDTTGYHVFNLFLHITNGILLYFLIRTTAVLLGYEIDKRVQLVAVFSSLIFVAHPIHTESVTYIVSRSVLISTCFFLLGIMLFVKTAVLKKRLSYIILLTLVSLLGMASREEFFLFPFMLFLYDIFFISQFRWRHVLTHWTIYIPVLIPLLYVLFIVLSYDYRQHAGFGVIDITPLEYLLTQFNVHWTYIRLLFLPINQNLNYDYPMTKTLIEFPAIISIVGYTGLWIMTFLLHRIKPVISFCLLWFLVSLVPSSSIIPIKDVIFEHRLYIPSIGLIILVPLAFIEMQQRIVNRFDINLRNTMVFFLSVVVIVLTSLTYQRNSVWQNNYTLWSDVANKSQNKAGPYIELGLVRLEEAKPREAILYFEEALKREPDNYLAYLNIGNAYDRLGILDKAISAYQRTIDLQPEFDDGHYNLGRVYFKKDMFSEAIKEFQIALSLNPLNYDARINLDLSKKRAQQNAMPLN